MRYLTWDEVKSLDKFLVEDNDDAIGIEIHTGHYELSAKVCYGKPETVTAYSLEELLEWGGKYARSTDELIQVEPKYDGISANFDGRVLATRGDGEEGEEDSENVFTD